MVIKKKTAEEALTSANKEMLSVSAKVIEVIKRYLKNAEYNDYTAFSYGKLVQERGDTLNTATFNQVVRTLAEVQKIQRLALEDEKLQAEKLPTPVINIDFTSNKIEK